MRQSLREIARPDTAPKLLIELILALEHIGLDYKKIIEDYRETIKKPLEETIENEE